MVSSTSFSFVSLFSLFCFHLSIHLLVLLVPFRTTNQDGVVVGVVQASQTQTNHKPEDYLSLGDQALSTDDYVKAIDFYEQGVAALKEEDRSLLTGK